MNRKIFYILVVASTLFFSTAWGERSAVCSLKYDPQLLSEYLYQDTCHQLLNSPNCQKLYKQIDQDELSQKYQLRCSENPENAIEYGHFYLGCYLGVFDATAGDLARGVGELGGRIVGDIQFNHSCEIHPELKRFLYLAHNADNPKDLQIPIPSDLKLKAYSCLDIKGAIFEEHRYLQVKLNRKKTYHAITESEGITLLAKNVLSGLGIRLECYNSQKQAELLCAAATYVGLAVLPVAVSAKLKLLGGIRELQKLEATTDTAQAAKILKTETIVKTVDDSSVDVQTIAIQEAHKVGRGERGADGRMAKVGNYTFRQKLKKARILKEAKISTGDRRSLFESGTVGDGENIEELIQIDDQLAQLEKDSWKYTATQKDFVERLRDLRTELDATLDSKPTEIENRIAQLQAKLKNLSEPKVVKINEAERVPKLEDIFLDPTKLREGQTIKLGTDAKNELSLKFESRALDDLQKAEKSIIQKFIGALKTGTGGESIDPTKIKFPVDIETGFKGRLFEVRIVNRGHQRLLGCLKDNVYTIMRYDPHAPETFAAFSLKYKDLCR